MHCHRSPIAGKWTGAGDVEEVYRNQSVRIHKFQFMKDILSEIIAHKRIEIEQQKQAVSLSQLQEQAAAMMQAQRPSAA